MSIEQTKAAIEILDGLKRMLEEDIVDQETPEKDNEIIKALNGADGLEHISLYCADNNGKGVTPIKIVDIIDLINRQKAEIERLKLEIDGVKEANCILRNNNEIAINKAITEFEERAEEEAYGNDLYDRNSYGVYAVTVEEIRQIAKEMKKGVTDTNVGSKKEGERE